MSYKFFFKTPSPPCPEWISYSKVTGFEHTYFTVRINEVTGKVDTLTSFSKRMNDTGRAWPISKDAKSDISEKEYVARLNEVIEFLKMDHEQDKEKTGE